MIKHIDFSSSRVAVAKKPFWLRALQKIEPVLPFRLLVSAEDGFDLGCFTWTWRQLGPFVVFREMGGPMVAPDDSRPLVGVWKLGVFLTDRAEVAFYEAVVK